MKNSSSERKTKTHKIARHWNFIKYKSIQISTNAFLNSSDVEADEMGWIICCIWKVTSGDNTSLAWANPHSHAVPVAGQEGVQVEIM